MLDVDKYVDELENLRQRNEQRVAEAKDKLGDKWLCHKSKQVKRRTPVPQVVARPLPGTALTRFSIVVDGQEIAARVSAYGEDEVVQIVKRWASGADEAVLPPKVVPFNPHNIPRKQRT